jgi:hypothetical protein
MVCRKGLHYFLRSQGEEGEPRWGFEISGNVWAEINESGITYSGDPSSTFLLRAFNYSTNTVRS